MLALGSAYRGDWAQVDGRALKAEMSMLEQLMQAELRGDQAAAMDLFRSVTCNVCLECGQWSEHCTDPEAHEAAARRADGDS